jgi:hypothetical protein
MAKYRTERRIKRQKDGLYHAPNGKTYKQLTGRRSQVGQGFAYKTGGGLLQKDLHFNGRRWVSLDKFKSASKVNRLKEHGYHTRKGKFGHVYHPQ